MKKQKGITLIALVVTVIVLLVLAGVTIGMLFNGDGIIKIASKTANSHKVEKIQEDLELLKTHVMTNNLEEYMKDNLGTYLNELEKQKDRYKVTSIERINQGNAEVIIEGQYEFAVYMASRKRLNNRIPRRRQHRTIRNITQKRRNTIPKHRNI